MDSFKLLYVIVLVKFFLLFILCFYWHLIWFWYGFLYFFNPICFQSVRLVFLIVSKGNASLDPFGSIPFGCIPHVFSYSLNFCYRAIKFGYSCWFVGYLNNFRDYLYCFVLEKWCHFTCAQPLQKVERNKKASFTGKIGLKHHVGPQIRAYK